MDTRMVGHAMRRRVGAPANAYMVDWVDKKTGRPDPDEEGVFHDTLDSAKAHYDRLAAQGGEFFRPRLVTFAGKAKNLKRLGGQ